MKKYHLLLLLFLLFAVNLQTIPVSAAAKKTEQSTTEKKTKTVKVGDKKYTVKLEKAVCYVTEDIGLNVRSLPDKDSELLGSLEYAEKVDVTGFVYETVNKNGKKKQKDTGWVEIKFQVLGDGDLNDKTAYIRNELSKESPVKSAKTVEPSVASSKAEPEYAECPYCGDWYEVGLSYDNHLSSCPYSYSEPDEPEYAQCPHCGDWYETGISYRSHVTACQYQASNPVEQDYAQCPYCGDWYETGISYRSHVTACQYNAPVSYGECPYCGGSFPYSGGTYEYHVTICDYNPSPALYRCEICNMLLTYEQSFSHYH